VSACLSSPIAVLATHTAPRPAGVDDAETVDLLAVLAGLPDPVGLEYRTLGLTCGFTVLDSIMLRLGTPW
jgi:hypothetical protein